MPPLLRNLIAIAFLLSSTALFAQNFQGLVIYKVEYKQIPEGVSSDRLCDQLYFYTNGEQHRIEEKGLPNGNVFLYSEGYPFETVLLNWLGHPVAISDPIEYPASPLKMEVEKAEVAGQKCSSFRIDDHIVFCADQRMGHFPWLPMLEYLPLSFTLEREGFEMELTAIQIEDMPIAASYFTVPKEYHMMSKGELQELFGEFDTQYSKE